MTGKVVDTNVLVVANGRDDNASVSCRLAALNALKKIIENDVVVVDEEGMIQREYKKYCEPSGQPGLGDEFYKKLLQEYSTKVRRVDLPRNPDGSYVDFPTDPRLRTFDQSDRKFVAAAVRSGAQVVNATDGDWLDHNDALRHHGVTVDFVCTESQDSWFA